MSASHSSKVEIEDPLFVWANRDVRARIVIGDDLSITWQNPAASHFLEGQIDIFAVHGRSIKLKSPGLNRHFADFIRSSGSEVTTLCLALSDSDYVLCTATNLIDDSQRRRTGVTLRRASETISVGAANLQAAFGFTPGERQVVERLFAGQTAEQTGDRLRLSVGTIRAHIRNIYEKLGVSSREALFSKLMPFMLLR
jgi:DNA-binding CsgD family transcriptional regulator